MKEYSKLYLFILFGIIAVFLGLLCFEQKILIEYYKNSIYWFMTLSCVLWGISLIETSKKEKINFQSLSVFFKYHWFALLLSLLLMILSVFIIKQDFLILADETNLLSVSQSLYNSKESLLDCSSFTYKSGAKDIIVGRLDKRPAFFPYLLSLIHSILGYRPNNVFVLNFITGFLSLFLLYYFIQLIWGRFWGLTGLVCLASYPLFIVYTNSGGFDVFNMMCSLVFFICLFKFIKNPDSLNAEVLLLWIPLIGQSRYESIMSILVALPMVFYYLPKKEYSNFSYRFVIFPLLFIAPAWLRRLSSDPSDWQVIGNEAVFSFEWFWQNINKAIVFFVEGGKDFGVIPLLSILALLGLLLFVYEVYIKKKNMAGNNDSFLSPFDYRIFWGAIFLFYVFHAVIKFSYKLTDLTNVFASRHAIIFLPLFIIMAVSFFAQINRLYSIKKVYYVVLCFILLICYWPEAASNLCGIKNFELYQELKFSRDFLKKYFPDKREYIILSREPFLYTPLEYSSIYLGLYENLGGMINNYYNQKFCSYFLAFQTLNSETRLPYDGYEIPKGLKSEIIFETHLQKKFIYRISRCIPKEAEIIEKEKQ